MDHAILTHAPCPCHEMIYYGFRKNAQDGKISDDLAGYADEKFTCCHVYCFANSMRFKFPSTCIVILYYCQTNLVA